MYLVLASNAYMAYTLSSPGRHARYAEVHETTTDRDVARQWLKDGHSVVAAIVDGSANYPTRYNRIDVARLGPRGGLAGVAWGIVEYSKGETK